MIALEILEIGLNHRNCLIENRLSRFFFFVLFQRIILRGPVAEWKAARPGHRDAWAVDLPWRVDAGLQGPLRRAAECNVDCQVRGHLGERAAGRLRLGDLR